MPAPSIKVPTSSALRHCLKLGSCVPRISCQAISNAPAHRKRVAIKKNGANPTSANRITRYVEPQTSQVAARQLSTKSDSRRRGGSILAAVLSGAKSQLDSLCKSRLAQCDISFPLQLNHFRLIEGDGLDLEAHDCIAITLHKQGRPSLIFVRPRGYRLPRLEYPCEPLGVGNQRQEFGHLRIVIEPRGGRRNSCIHDCEPSLAAPATELLVYQRAVVQVSRRYLILFSPIVLRVLPFRPVESFRQQLADDHFIAG